MNERKHLTGREIEKLIAATKGSRNESRDRCLLLLMFRHGLRVSEALGLTTADLDLEGRTLHVRRLKKDSLRRTRCVPTKSKPSGNGLPTATG
jgi:type 1 fimbriae regulatory protein FimB